ncbi:MAG: aquaporin [Ardenticatenaceae bacterium]|nr:aquaporin [Ardenticatenaceae bacterium]
MSKYIAEFMGTFALVFVGTGAIIVNDTYDGIITHVGVAISFWLVIMVMIYAVGAISGAHFNPAVTIGFWLHRTLATREVMPYIGHQVAGAFAASLLLRVMFPQNQTLGTTIPTVGTGTAFLMEVVLTFFLMFVIISVVEGPTENLMMAGLAIGATVGMCALLAGPVTGASMNPARSLAPAIVSGIGSNLWIYLAAPFVGAGLAVGIWRWLQQSKRGLV